MKEEPLQIILKKLSTVKMFSVKTIKSYYKELNVKHDILVLNNNKVYF